MEKSPKMRLLTPQQDSFSPDGTSMTAKKLLSDFYPSMNRALKMKRPGILLLIAIIVSFRILMLFEISAQAKE